MRMPWLIGDCHAKNKHYDEGLKTKLFRTELLEVFAEDT